MKKLYKSWVRTLTYLTVIAISILLPLLGPTELVSAAVPSGSVFEFIDGANIQVKIDGTVSNGKNIIPVKMDATFLDKNPWDKELEFRAQGQECNDSWIHLDGRTSSTGKMKIQVPNPFDGGRCYDAYNNESITFGSGSLTKNQLYFNWVDEGKINAISGNVALGPASAGSKVFNGLSDSNVLEPNVSGKCSFTLTVKANNLNGDLEVKCGDAKNKPGIFTNVSIGNVEAATAKAGTGGGGVDAAGDARPSCETTSGNPLSWGLCPLINGAAAAADWVLEDFIVPFLDDVPITLDRTGDNAGIFDAWSAFRILANIMLVGVMLFIVIAESTGGGE